MVQTNANNTSLSYVLKMAGGCGALVTTVALSFGAGALFGAYATRPVRATTQNSVNSQDAHQDVVVEGRWYGREVLLGDGAGNFEHIDGVYARRQEQLQAQVDALDVERKQTVDSIESKLAPSNQ